MLKGTPCTVDGRHGGLAQVDASGGLGVGHLAGDGVEALAVAGHVEVWEQGRELGGVKDVVVAVPGQQLADLAGRRREDSRRAQCALGHCPIARLAAEGGCGDADELAVGGPVLVDGEVPTGPESFREVLCHSLAEGAPEPALVGRGGHLELAGEDSPKGSRSWEIRLGRLQWSLYGLG